jgi:hypothetical protein
MPRATDKSPKTRTSSYGVTEHLRTPEGLCAQWRREVAKRRLNPESEAGTGP